MRKEGRKKGGRERGGRDGQMEEWDPRDVSFITPPCSLHSFSLSFSFSAGLFFFFHIHLFSIVLALHSYIHSFIRSLSSFLPSFHLLAVNSQTICLSLLPAIFCSLPYSLAFIFRFHHLLWRHPSSPLSIFASLSLSFTVVAFSFYPFTLSVPKSK